MGAVSSFPLKAINDNPFIKKLIGEDPISEDDQFWDGLLLFSFTIPTTRSVKRENDVPFYFLLEYDTVIYRLL